MWAEEGENGNQICEGLITKRDGDGRFGEGQGGRIVKHLDRGIGGVGGFRVKILEGQLPLLVTRFVFVRDWIIQGKRCVIAISLISYSNQLS
jgi:hypothetical protein